MTRQDDLERNAIVLLNNFGKPTVDARRDCWLGRYSRSRAIRESGLRNVDHVDEGYESDALGVLQRAVEETTPP